MFFLSSAPPLLYSCSSCCCSPLIPLASDIFISLYTSLAPPLTHVTREVVAPYAKPGYLDARYDNATKRKSLHNQAPKGYKWFTWPSIHDKLS